MYTNTYAILSQFVRIKGSIHACTYMYSTYLSGIHTVRVSMYVIEDKYTSFMDTAHTYMYYITYIMCAHRYI